MNLNIVKGEESFYCIVKFSVPFDSSISSVLEFFGKSYECKDVISFFNHLYRRPMV